MAWGWDVGSSTGSYKPCAFDSNLSLYFLFVYVNPSNISSFLYPSHRTPTSSSSTFLLSSPQQHVYLLRQLQTKPTMMGNPSPVPALEDNTRATRITIQSPSLHFEIAPTPLSPLRNRSGSSAISRVAFARMASWRNTTLQRWIVAVVPLLVAISLLLGSYRPTPSQFPWNDFRVSGLSGLDPSSLESQISFKMLHQQPA